MRWLVGANEEVKRDRNDIPVNTIGERMVLAALAELGSPVEALRARGIARYFRRERVQVVLAEFGPVACDYIDPCRDAGIPLVAHFHGYDAYKRSTIAEYGARYQRLFREAKAIVVVSHDMARQLVSLGAPADRIVWNPCGVDVRHFGGGAPASSAPLFVSVGRFVEKKAPHSVLLAFRHVAQHHPEARLVMIGEGILLDMTRQLCRSLGLDHCVQFTGALSPPEVAAHLRAARAFVQHSMRDADGNAEGTPVAVLEAGATGLPIVATRHMGISDVVIHGETGLLVDEGDVDGMGQHLIALCDDPALAGTLGRQGRERICSEFSMERSIERLWGALEIAMGRVQVPGAVAVPAPAPGVVLARQ
jgi:glycosyltransferase involved in cell wall biosynthesis